MNFKDLGVSNSILNALETEGYSQATPIQQQAIPHALQGKDLLACAQTGTGKTAAFAIPVLQQLSVQGRQKHIRALVLTPTRELAIQIEESFYAYGKNLPLKTAVIFGGVSQHQQVNTLRNGVDILVATPGRLIDLIQQGYIALNKLEILILDEADRMLDMGFVHDVKRIIALVPTKRQTLFFSATMPKEILSLANSILHNAVKVEVTPVSSTAQTIQQKLYYVDKDNKNDLLRHVIENENINMALVFTRTKHGADKLVKYLIKNNITAQAIHGNKTQAARQNALNNFKDHKTRILIATDIAARGIDVDKLSHVFNFELPEVPETYVHRIGRTGRAGNSGISYSFCEEEETAYLRDIQKLIGKTLPVVSDHPFHEVYTEIKKRPAKQGRPARNPSQRPAPKSNFGSSSANNKRKSNNKRFSRA